MAPFRPRAIMRVLVLGLFIFMALICLEISTVFSSSEGKKGKDDFLVPHSSDNSKNASNLGLNEVVLSQVKKLTVSEIKRNILNYNLQQTVLNEDMFGPLESDSVVIVIQVHSRIAYLRHLIESLIHADNIHKALLIFSHDYYDEDINKLIQSIYFCKVMQIFFPHSIQTHEYEFPGEDPMDCPRNISIDEAIKINCNNAFYPDLYGHYREAKFSQIKHHWWWKANRVFEGLEVTKDHSGQVLFLEEDHYVTEDFLHMLWLMKDVGDRYCQDCNVFCLGTHFKKTNYNSTSDKVEVGIWQSTMHNMGMALTRKTWERISSCAMTFCYTDDYNWDWSLQAVIQECLSSETTLKVMVSKSPRVFHTGDCGVHQKKANCDSGVQMAILQKILIEARKYLYPEELTIEEVVFFSRKALRNGGWGDVRDQELCINIAKEAKTANRRRQNITVDM